MNKLTLALSLSAVGIFGGLATAHADPPQHPPRVPPEAVAACNGSTEGAACSVNFHGRDIAGTCRSVPDVGLACFPNAPPPPPEEAFQACTNQSEGSACTVTFHDREIHGTCVPFPDRGLVCRPNGPPPEAPPER